MLTDAEVADVARLALADELADLAPRADLLKHVRAQHARGRKARRATMAAATAVAAGGLTAAIIAGTAVTAPGLPRSAATHTLPGSAAAGEQTVKLDGFTIKVARPVRAVKWLLFSGKLPVGATQVGLSTGVGYVTRTAAGPSLYIPVRDFGQVHYLVLSFVGVSESQLIKLAGSITIAGKLRSLPR